MKMTISMSREEQLYGLLYLLNQMFVLPFLLQLVNSLLLRPFTEAQLNILFFFINFSAVTLIFHRFLRKSLEEAMRNLWRCFKYAFWGLIIYKAATYLVDWLIFSLRPDYHNANDASIAQMVSENSFLLSLCTIFLVPLTEECLYRGLFFLGLSRRGRLAAYGVSSLLFAAVHIVGYLGQVPLPMLLLSLLQYLPAGICLGWAYEKSNTILTPILIHMAVNQIGISSMR